MTKNVALPERRKEAVKEYPRLPLNEIKKAIESKCGNVCIAERHGNGKCKVFILPEAKQELDVMISYGRRSPMNIKEQKYAGYGHFLIDEDDNPIVIVKHFIEIQTMNRNAVGASNLGPNGEYNHGLDFLEYHREEFLKNEARFNTDSFGCQIDPFMKICGPSEFVLEGHTHPDLGVFYSPTDKVSGAARAASAPVCIFVCDPIRRKMLGSIGRDFREAEVIVYSRKSICSESMTAAQNDISADDFIAIAGQCLRLYRYTGYIKYRTRIDGDLCLKIRMVIPQGGPE